METTIQTVIATLEKLFTTFNEHFYEGKLEKPIITVSPDVTGGSYGWCSINRLWKQEGTDGFREINLCAEHLARPFKATCATLLHEMVHLWNLQNNVKDTSRGCSYHNKKFKSEAELRGLFVEHDTKYGWTVTTLSSETDEWINTAFSDTTKFDLHRLKLGYNAEQEDDDSEEEKPKKKSTSKKYVCPSCHNSVRATKEVNISCDDCEVKMEVEG